jgi:hypothetical protein
MVDEDEVGETLKISQTLGHGWIYLDSSFNPLRENVQLMLSFFLVITL